MQLMLPMNGQNQIAAWDQIREVRASGSTNLWQGHSSREMSF
jgi:hypothetical protein